MANTTYKDLLGSGVLLNNDEGKQFLHTEYVNEYTRVKLNTQTDKYESVEHVDKFELKTDTTVPKLGLMLVGWGGNNGSTLTASLIANRKQMSWKTRRGEKEANYFGSLLMASTTKIGINEKGEDVFVPLNTLMPMVHPNDIVLGGWDISEMNLGEALDRSQVLEPDLKSKLYDEMKKMKPMPSIYYKDFIALNQSDRANNLINNKSGGEQSKQRDLDEIRKNIRDFKAEKGLDRVIVLWTANTERFSDLIDGVNDTSESLLRSVKESHSEVSPSTIFAMASIMEGCPFINGSPQNTFVPGVVELAHKHDVYIGGDDFKSGQTKMKSVLVDFFVSAGIKPVAITSYNHLGNNDGLNLNSPSQFRSKEISKRNVVDDMVESNKILYKKESGEHPDHVVVIKYVPAVGDTKRALDEYENEIFMGGSNTISMHNTCEDSLLATPLILDLAILCELCTRVQIKRRRKEEQKDTTTTTITTETKFENFHPVLSLLSYMLKAPLSAHECKPVNSLFRQRNAIENFLRACIGRKPNNDLMMHRLMK